MTLGVQTSGEALRICGVDSDGSVTFSRLHPLDRPFTREDWANPSDRLAEEIARHIEDRTNPLCLALPGGFYHTRRVPMEVAEDVDRRSQVVWEVSQTLAAPVGSHRVDYSVRGSSAIWVAIPTAIVDALTAAFATYGIELIDLCAGPLALEQVIRRRRPTGPATGVLAESGWITRLGLSDGHLVSLTSVGPVASDTTAAVSDLPAFLQKHAGDATDDPVFLAADPADLHTVASRDGVVPLYPEDRDPDDHIDTLTSVAYGAALFTQNEDRL